MNLQKVAGHLRRTSLTVVRMSLWASALMPLGCSRSPSASENPPQSSPATTTTTTGPKTSSSLPLSPGSPAPRFAVTAHNGEKVSLEGLRGKVIVLYFYPKDGTPGCTTEAKEFRDQYASFQAKSAVVLGVSSDDNGSHEDFAQELGLPFLLLPDPEGALRSAYGVGSFLGISSRVTFIIDREGKIAHIYPKVDPKSHASEVLRVVERL
jgi:thioredoxin-dependent peroxiredoxin